MRVSGSWVVYANGACLTIVVDRFLSQIRYEISHYYENPKVNPGLPLKFHEPFNN